MTDLHPGMMLEGVVTNVANFGAFVDIGVHQDGLVHISNLADVFVKDPRSVVKTGEMIKVKVLEVDLARKRIALTMKTNGDEVKTKPAAEKKRNRGRQNPKQQSSSQGMMANAFAKALKK
jgi:uncharacterized protein